MGKFLRENWVWIVAPIVIVVIVLGVLVYFQPDASVEPFNYPLH